MKNLNNKISAFTLVEVIMVMILSLLVLGIVLLGFKHFQQYRAIQEKESQRLEEILLIQSALNTWFFKAHKIVLADEAIVFKDSVIFGLCKFEEEFLILEANSNVDRFKVKPAKLRITKCSELPYVSELYFEIEAKGKLDPFLFRKNYGKSVLFNSKERDYEH
jgi:type II secretory pathway pseudopilin PulG